MLVSELLTTYRPEFSHQAFVESLQNHVPADTQEANHKARILRHVESGGPLFDRQRWDGHLTGSAFILNHERTHILLIFHRKLQRWLQPGGHGEPNETHPLEVAYREAREECGLDDLLLYPQAGHPFDLDVHLIPPRADEPAHEHLDVRYLFVVPAGTTMELDPQLEEVQGCSWVQLEDALQDGNDYSVMRAVRKVLRIVGR
jgi:8-oxo-dGTP pyrophosphatase MutT (NUDIX family)